MRFHAGGRAGTAPELLVPAVAASGREGSGGTLTLETEPVRLLGWNGPVRCAEEVGTEVP